MQYILLFARVFLYLVYNTSLLIISAGMCPGGGYNSTIKCMYAHFRGDFVLVDD